MMEREPGNPTPAQIRARCAKIRSTWSEAERIKRRDAVPRFSPRDWDLVEKSEAAKRGRAG